MTHAHSQNSELSRQSRQQLRQLRVPLTCPPNAQTHLPALPLPLPLPLLPTLISHFTHCTRGAVCSDEDLHVQVPAKEG